LKKIIFIVLIIISAFCQKNILAKSIGEINSDNINLRTAPSMDSLVLKTLKSGSQIEILDEKNDFYKILFDGLEAYIAKKFVNILQTEGIVNSENVNIRVLPYEDAGIITRAMTGDKLEIYGQLENWFVINLEKTNAYIAKKYVTCDQDQEKIRSVNMPPREYALVISNNGINLRKSNSLESQIICSVPENIILDVLDKNYGDWIKVAFENKIGYVNLEYIKLFANTKPELEITRAQKIINYAKNFIGTPYRYGGSDLNKGVDCSGFVYSVMKSFGININRSSVGQSKNGNAIDKSELIPGDLVFFSNGGAKNIQHVGIYIGNGQFIHSASPNNKGVTINKLTDNYYAINYITARRVV